MNTQPQLSVYALYKTLCAVFQPVWLSVYLQNKWLLVRTPLQ